MIEKFDGENWHIWKLKIKFILIDKGLWKIVSGRVQKPFGPGVTPEDVEKWEDLDERALSCICLHMKDSQLLNVSKAESSAEAWESLETLYEHKNAASLLFLLQQFFTIKMSEGDSIAAHINKVRELAEQLASIGEKVSDLWMIMTLLGSLPESYQTLVVTLGTKEPSALTMEMVTAQLQQEESRHQGSGSSSEAALMVTKKDKSYNHSHGESKSSHDHKKNAKCRYCGKKGHYEKECRTKERDFKSGKLKKSFQKNQANTVKTEEDDTAFVAALSASVSSDMWYLDSGASQHMTGCRAWFSKYENLSLSRTVTLGDDRDLVIKGKGSIPFQFLHGDCMDVQDILHVEGLRKNLISLSKLRDQRYRITFDDVADIFTFTKDGISFSAVRSGTLYLLQGSVQKSPEAHLSLAKHGLGKADLWHQRYGHLCITNLKKLKEDNLVRDFDMGKNSKLEFCEGCVYGKQHRDKFPKDGGTRATRILELVHSDVNGPMKTPTHGGAKYFVLFIDDFTRKTFVYFLTQKSQVLEKFKEFKAFVENETGCQIQTLRSDNGGEYTSKAFNDFCREHGIQRQFSTPYTPQQNGVAERKNRTLVESARCMLQHAGLSNVFWAEAINTAVYVLNRAPTSAVKGKTPQEAWSGKKPTVEHFRVFGCEAYAHVSDEKRTKLDLKSVKCIFLGYYEGSKCYRLFNPEKKTIVKSRDVKFVEVRETKEKEGIVEVSNEPLERIIKVENFVESEDSSSESENEGEEKVGDLVSSTGQRPLSVKQIRSEARKVSQTQELESISPPPPSPRITRSRAREIARAQAESASSASIPITTVIDSVCMAHAFHTSIDEPLTISEAMGRDDSSKWKEAMELEFQSLIDNKTWELVPLPKDRKSIGCKWIYKIKYNADGSVERYKARLVALGYLQKEGIDYTETFAPVAKMTSIRTLLALAAIDDAEIHQMDVKTAFLNGDLEEEIYMDQPKGFSSKSKEDMVCKLSKTIYGLKQSPRAWYKKIDQYFELIGLKKSHADPNIYVLRNATLYLIIALYVDDLIMVCNDLSFLLKTKVDLSKVFDMKDLGEIFYILGLQITRDRTHRMIHISQTKYIQSILKRYGMEDCKSLATPLDANSKLSKDMAPLTSEDINSMASIPYQSAVGSLVYAMIGTRADIAYAVGVVSQYMTNPGPLHWTAVKRIFRYLKGTMDHGLSYGGSPISQVVGYCDADYAGDIDTRKSTTGYTFLLYGGAISWNSKKQPTIALSTTEAEYMAATHAAKEAIWLQRFFRDTGFLQDVPMTIYSDNQSCISLSKNPTFHARTKHVEIHHHFVRKKIEEDKIDLVFCGTQDMVADVLTKGLTREKHSRFKEMMGIIKLN